MVNYGDRHPMERPQSADWQSVSAKASRPTAGEWSGRSEGVSLIARVAYGASDGLPGDSAV